MGYRFAGRDTALARRSTGLVVCGAIVGSSAIAAIVGHHPAFAVPMFLVAVAFGVRAGRSWRQEHDARGGLDSAGGGA